MIKNFISTIYSACMLLLCCGLPVWESAAHAAVAPSVSTLSAITDGSVTPVRIAADMSGNIYVTDPRGGGVLKYNGAGALVQKISTVNRDLLGIAIASNGDVLVSQGASVAVYTSTGTYVKSFGNFGRANGIAVDDTGTLFVVDSTNNNVQIFNLDYTLKSTFGATGNSAGQFKQPTGITFEKVSRQLAVVDTLNGRVQFFSTAGVYQKTVGSFGSGPLKFTSPQGIAFEYTLNGTSLSRMYVVDSFQANVQVIDAASTSFLRYIGSYGTLGGQLITPGDLLIDPFNRLIIPNGTGSLVLFGVADASSALPPGGTAISFPSPSSGSNPPVLTLNTLPSVTRNGLITVSGTASAGSAVSVNSASATIDANGNWTRSVLLTAQGLNDLVVTATKDSNTSTLSAYITLDSAAPVVTVSTIPQSGSSTSTPIQTIAGAVSDTSATFVTITVNGVPRNITVNDGLFSTAIILSSGSNLISVSTTDAAGNSSSPFTSSVTYNPLALGITVTSAGGAVIGGASASYIVTGTSPINSQVTVNGIPAAMTETRWSAAIPLQTGINQIIITASIIGAPLTSTQTSYVTYAPVMPSLSVTAPIADSGTVKASPEISGSASPGASITASLNGVSLQVTVASDGSFIVPLPAFTTPGTYSVFVSAIDGNGRISSTTRTLVYDPTPPSLTLLDTAPSAIKVSSANGVVIARDKNGYISTQNNSNGTSSLDLSGAVYDQATLDIFVLTPVGASSRDGDINGDGTVDIADALLAAQVSLGAAPALSFEKMLHADVGPLVNHTPVPDGRIRLEDVILILQKSVGIDW
jgi:uncharacterized protein YfaP (DUF2135 family)